MRVPTVERPHLVGVGTQRLYRFPNGYGASVVRFRAGPMGGSYGVEEGLWELAVIKYTGADSQSFNLVYDTPITDDVIGWLSDEDVESTLARIEELPRDR